jgi:serine protease
MIVKFRDDGLHLRSGAEAMGRRLLQNQAQIERVGGQLVRQLGRINAVAAELSAEQVTALRQDARVAYVEPDPVRKPFLPTSVSAVTPQSETVPYGISMVQADQLGDASIGNRKVCIIDTGYDGTHEDLRATSGVTGNDDNGLGNDTGDWFHDGYGHGTHVAGTISAVRGNDKGVVGVSGSNAIGLHIVKVFDDFGGWAYGSDLVVAVEQCMAAGANVISMSLGGSFSSTAEEAAFNDAYANGVLAIAAAGNGGDSSMSFPASYDAVVSVAALDSSKTHADFSQTNSQVELAAPGVGVLSTLPGNLYEAWDGTSMATPHVSGVAALVWSYFPDCPPAAIRHALAMGAEDLGSEGRDPSYGFGLVRAQAAHDFIAANGCVLPPPPPPPPPAEELVNGVLKTGISGGQGEQDMFVINVPASAANLVVTMNGGSGDADLYVRYGNEPNLSAFDCRPYIGGNFEVCTFPTPSEGPYYVMAYGYSSYTDTTLLATYTKEGCTGQTLSASGLPVAIPDNSATGVRATVTSELEGTVASLLVNASIKHTYRGDLVVTLIAPSGENYVLAKRTGGATDDLALYTEVPAAVGVTAAGDWQLLVQDRASKDVGTLTAFDLTITPNCN